MTAPSAAPLRRPVVELVARYGVVARAAWAARHELAGPRRLAHEAAFLPAALAIQETPVHPAPRRAMWIIVALFAGSVLWSIVGHVDIVASAPGRLVVSEGRHRVQSLEAAVVRRVHVREGDAVRAGHVLVELDPTAVAADSASIAAQAAAAQREVSRVSYLLDALDSNWALAPDGTAQAEWKDLQARRARLAAEVHRRKAEQATERSVLAGLHALLPLARQRETDVQALAAQGFLPGHAGQDRTRERIQLEREEATQSARVAEADAVHAESLRASTALEAEIRRSLHDRLERARQEVAQLTPQQRKGEFREALTVLRAPADGRVQELMVHAPGGVVTPAQTLMVVVPERSGLHLEAMLDNKDIGFVHMGQAAHVKLEAFPFTRHGTVAGSVESISDDAVIDDQGIARFRILVRLDRPTMPAGGRDLRLGAGMNATAEVHTGSRRVIHFLLDPLQRTLQESAGER